MLILPYWGPNNDYMGWDGSNRDPTSSGVPASNAHALGCGLTASATLPIPLTLLTLTLNPLINFQDQKNK